MSVTSRIISSSVSRFFFCLAETSTNTVSPPQSSGIRPRSASCRFGISGLAPGLSILLTATMIGTPAALRVVDRLARLRHHAVVGRDDEDDDVGDLRAAGAHQGEGLVARRVEEDDLLVALLARPGTRYAPMCWVMPPASRSATRVVANRVEQRRLAVVDVAHDRDDGRARHQVLRVDGFRFGLDQFLFVGAGLDLGAERARDFSRRSPCRSAELMVIIMRRSSSAFSTSFDAHVELVREILHRHAFGERDGAAKSAAAPRARRRGHALQRVTAC